MPGQIISSKHKNAAKGWCIVIYQNRLKDSLKTEIEEGE